MIRALRFAWQRNLDAQKKLALFPNLPRDSHARAGISNGQRKGMSYAAASIETRREQHFATRRPFVFRFIFRSFPRDRTASMHSLQHP